MDDTIMGRRARNGRVRCTFRDRCAFVALLPLLVFATVGALTAEESRFEDPQEPATEPVSALEELALEEPAPEEPDSDEPESAEPAQAPASDEAPVQMPKVKKTKSRFYFGGWLGASGGEAIDLVEFAPEVGYRITPKFHIGGSLIYRYRKDKRFDPDLTTRDIGGSLFSRYFFYGPLFGHLGAERITWDYIVNTPVGPETLSADHTAILLGPGFAMPMGPNAATYLTVLYDVNYDNQGPNPYDRPWFIRIGVGVGL